MVMNKNSNKTTEKNIHNSRDLSNNIFKKHLNNNFINYNMDVYGYNENGNNRSKFAKTDNLKRRLSKEIIPYSFLTPIERLQLKDNISMKDILQNIEYKYNLIYSSNPKRKFEDEMFYTGSMSKASYFTLYPKRGVKNIALYTV